MRVNITNSDAKKDFLADKTHDFVVGRHNSLR